MVSGHGGSSRSGGGNKRPPPKGVKSDTRAKAERLVQDTGIPRPLAFQVAMGNLSVNEALQKLAMRDKVDGLMRRHELPRSLATQIALGQADLDAALAKRRLRDLLAAHGHDSILVQARAKDQPVVLALHGGEFVKGTVSRVDKFEIELTPAQGDALTVHKVHMRFAAWASDLAKVRSQIKSNAEYATPVEPVFRPAERYGMSDRRLFRYVEEDTRIAVTVLEGDQFLGTVDWMSRWEFGLKLGRGVGVAIFRHALADVREA